MNETVGGSAVTHNDITWERWGELLFEHIFCGSSTRVEVARITSSHRVLAAVTKLTPGSAQKKFIRSFGDSPSAVLAKFKFPRNKPSEIELRRPPKFFASLYLSLLAASADEDTSQFGDFRRRFALLVNTASGKAVFEEGDLSNAFASLPAMWDFVSIWLERNIDKGENWCRLALPKAAAHERLIGISKRLAFPGYRDERQMRKILLENGLDSSAFPERVCELFSREVYNSNAGLTQNFFEEFQVFSSLINGREHDITKALQTPFWGAINDVSLDGSGESKGKLHEYCFELAISESLGFGFEANVYADHLEDSGREDFELKRFSYRNKYRYVSKHNSIHEIQKLLERLARTYRGNYQVQKLNAALTVGFLSLYPDEFGQFNTDGRYSTSSGEVLFLVNQKNRENLQRLPIELYKVKEIFNQGGEPGWYLLHFVNIDESARKNLFQMLPAELNPGIRYYGNVHQQSIKDLVRLKGTTTSILNDFTCEHFFYPNATKGSWRLLDGENESAAGDLFDAGGGVFRLPKELKQLTLNGQWLETTLTSPNGRTFKKKIRCFSEAPYPCRPKYLDSSFVSDGLYGPLSLMDLEPQPEKAENNGLRYFRRSPVRISSRLSPPENVAPSLSQILEVYSARFESSKVINESELWSHRFEALRLGVSFVTLVSARFQNGGLIKRVLPNVAYNKYTLVAAEKRFVSSSEWTLGTKYTITGIFNRNERAHLIDYLYGKNCQVDDPKSYVDDGGLPLTFIGSESLPFQELKEKFYLEVIDVDHLNPFEGFSSGCFMRARRNQFLGEEVKYWNIKRKCWVVDKTIEDSGVYLTKAEFSTSVYYQIVLEDECFQTTSEAWAFLWFSYLNHGFVATLTAGLELLWNESISQIPPQFALWWSHRLRGHVSATHDGRIIMTGCKEPEKLRRFFEQEVPIFHKDTSPTALARWRGRIKKIRLRNAREIS